MMYKAGYDVLEFEKLDTDELFQQYIEAVQAAALKNYDKMKVIIELIFLRVAYSLLMISNAFSIEIVMPSNLKEATKDLATLLISFASVLIFVFVLIAKAIPKYTY